MHIDILTIFPEMFASPFDSSLIKRARDIGILNLRFHNIRSFTNDPHRSVDDSPYGGGDGMIMKVEPIVAGIRHVQSIVPETKARVILLTPQGRPVDQEKMEQLSTQPRLLMICGHYGGVDERVRSHYVDEEISIGDYVLTGGELPAMVLIDGIARLLPGVVGNAESVGCDSFQGSLLEYPQYTRPAEFEGHSVPEPLMSGNHEKIAKWRKSQSIQRTLHRRPDLLKGEKIAEE